MEALLSHIRNRLETFWDTKLPDLAFRSVGGGCINQTGIVHSPHTPHRAFLKIHTEDRLPNFEAEAAGLEEIAQSNTIAVPRPMVFGRFQAQAYLIMEALDLRTPTDRHRAEEHLGRDLAALHRVRGDAFGWHRDNVIGDTEQINTPETSWPHFFGQHRLSFQVNLAQRKGLDLPGAETLLEKIATFFPDEAPPPSLLHGDLWTGNIGFAAPDDRPVLFDPAVYYGDRETDVAFTEMFGGLSGTFYKAYHAAYPLDPGYSRHRNLYNLYHILNHYNLFGGGYGQQARSVLQSLLR